MDAITIILILLAIAIIVAAVFMIKRRSAGRVLIAPAASQRKKGSTS